LETSIIEVKKEAVMALEQVFTYSCTLAKLRSDPLGHLLDNFCDSLLDQGFTLGTIRLHLRHVSHLNTWLADEKWKWEEQLTQGDVDAFYAAYRLLCRNRGPQESHLRQNWSSINRFCKYLEGKSLFEARKETPCYEALLSSYLQWMKDHQYAAAGTLEVRRSSLVKFFNSLGSTATCDGMGELMPDGVESFFLDIADTMGNSARRSMQTALRTFLRFCFHMGFIHLHLDEAVPTLRTYKLAQVPRGVDESQAQTILQSVDCGTPVGRRDYAILTILHAYGVRGGQIRALKLSDIDWDNGQILFRATKNGKDSLLPITREVGESILNYLREGRPACSFHEVFITSRAPYRNLTCSCTLSTIVRRHMGADINVSSKGSHAFRHAFATRKVAAGYSLKAVADVLGHRHLSTTFMYTKVDFNALNQVAMEWPKEVLS
jgi:integrase/recombinase XerD